MPNSPGQASSLICQGHILDQQGSTNGAYNRDTPYNGLLNLTYTDPGLWAWVPDPAFFGSLLNTDVIWVVTVYGGPVISTGFRFTALVNGQWGTIQLGRGDTNVGLNLEWTYQVWKIPKNR